MKYIGKRIGNKDWGAGQQWKTTEEKVKKATVRPKIRPHKIFHWLPTAERLLHCYSNDLFNPRQLMHS